MTASKAKGRVGQEAGVNKQLGSFDAHLGQSPPWRCRLRPIALTLKEAQALWDLRHQLHAKNGFFGEGSP